MHKIIAILFSLLFTAGNDLQTGIDYFNARSENAVGLQANAINVDKAILIFEDQLNQKKNVKVAGGYCQQCLNFKGRFVYTEAGAKKDVFIKAIALGNELVKQYPKDGKIRFELISSIALFAEIDGVLKSMEGGVMPQMLYHTKMLIETESMYNEGGGWKILAALNYKTPYIPVVMTWPNKERAKTLMKKALKNFPKNVGNNFYFGEALLENNEKSAAKIYFELVLKLPSRKDFTLEDEFFKVKARKHLDEMKKKK